VQCECGLNLMPLLLKTANDDDNDDVTRRPNPEKCGNTSFEP